MPKPNVYLSDKDRQILIDVIYNYIGTWEDIEMDKIELKELVRVRDKIRNVHKTKGFKNALINDSLEIANKALLRREERKKRHFGLPTCRTCKHWQEVDNEWIAYCPILKEKTEADESCHDFEDLDEED